ncbi:MAG: molybdopterin-dependent oxidoreductase, partial [Verrucomicrobiota bacterium]
EIAVIGEAADLTYQYLHLGAGPDTLAEFPAEARNYLSKAERPLILVGMGAVARPDGAAVLGHAMQLAASVGAVKEGWTALSPGVSGDIRWSGDKVEARDRNPDGAVSPLFRDLVQADGATTLHHRISNGVWKVTLNMSDPEFPHDLMGLRAEGQLISDAITVPAGHYGFVDAKGASSTEVSFEVEVNDGELTLEFFDNGGEDANWVVSRLSLEKR